MYLFIIIKYKIQHFYPTIGIKNYYKLCILMNDILHINSYNNTIVTTYLIIHATNRTIS